jgi:hypothetical protein
MSGAADSSVGGRRLCRYDLGCRFSREEAVVIRIRADSEREGGDDSGDVQRRRAA